MLAKLGLRPLGVAAKLYCAAALLLAVTCIWALAAIRFALETEDAATQLRQDGLVNIAAAARAQVLIEQQGRLVALAAAGRSTPADEARYGNLSKGAAAFLDQIGAEDSGRLAAHHALLVWHGAEVFRLLASGSTDDAHAAAAGYAVAAARFVDDLQGEATARLATSDLSLATLGWNARSLSTSLWVMLGMTGLAAGPLGYMFLRQMLMRLEGIGTALNRLARNDTSVEIPDVDTKDEFGQLARSVSVFKAKSIELLNKKADFERLNLQLDTAINHMPLGLSMFDGNERLLVCNRRYAEMHDLPGELTRPGTVHCALWDQRVRNGAQHSRSRDALIASADSHSMQIEYAGGRTIAVSRQPMRGGGWVSLHEDITERRRREETTARLARHDALTSLANRVLFHEQLEQSLLSLVSGQGFAVLCLDLDRFKEVNDTLGHPVGDALLKQVSERLLGCVRHGDLVARLGGDEFAIIQAGVRDPARTETLADRIIETVSAPYDVDGHRVTIGTSIGMTLAPRDGAEADELLRNADLALYRSKSEGRGRHAFFRREMSDAVESKRSLEADLRRALGDDDLTVSYQPVVNLANDEVAGANAVAGWHHPGQGFIDARQLAEIAEEAGVVTELGDWVLRQACEHAMRWPRSVKVSVSVSPLQFSRRSIIESVLQALAQSGLPPGRLELQVPEIALLHENRGTLAMLHQLRQVGVNIALEDFGVGYASLVSLRAFPFDAVKLDKGLIVEAERKDQSRAVLEAVISLCNSLGMVTVANGIDTFEQLAQLRRWRCAQAQGHLLGPNLRASEFEAAVRRPVAQADAVNPASGGSDELPVSSQAA
jgi:diguanylate cyclase (GGDEF)-like protein